MLAKKLARLATTPIGNVQLGKRGNCQKASSSYPIFFNNALQMASHVEVFPLYFRLSDFSFPFRFTVLKMGNKDKRKIIICKLCSVHVLIQNSAS